MSTLPYQNDRISCTGHGTGSGVVPCSGCAAPGCPRCFEQIGDALYCTGCLLRKLQTAESEACEMEVASAIHDLRATAARRIRRNWILTGLFSVVGVPAMAGMIADDRTISAAGKFFGAPIAGLAAIYLIWASLWGIPAVWNWWKNLFRDSSAAVSASGMGWLLMIVGFFMIPLEFGYLYGAFGGGFYEYRKARRLANGMEI